MWVLPIIIGYVRIYVRAINWSNLYFEQYWCLICRGVVKGKWALAWLCRVQFCEVVECVIGLYVWGREYCAEADEGRWLCGDTWAIPLACTRQGLKHMERKICEIVALAYKLIQRIMCYFFAMTCCSMYFNSLKTK